MKAVFSRRFHRVGFNELVSVFSSDLLSYGVGRHVQVAVVGWQQAQLAGL